MSRFSAKEKPMICSCKALSTLPKLRPIGARLETGF
jgi:hypothetical protein